jgi:hypothetical protein
MYGYHDPREESIESYKNYCYKLEMDTTNLVFLKDSAMFMKYYTKADEPTKHFNIGLPELYVFDRSGRLLKYKPDTVCNGAGFDFTKNVCNAYLGLKKTEYNYIDFSKFFIRSNGQAVSYNINEYDVIVVITWAKFVGQLNRDHVKVWEQNLSNAKNCKVKIIKACLDPIKGMNLDLKTQVK